MTQMTITHDFDGVTVEFDITFDKVEAEPDVGISEGFENLWVKSMSFMDAEFLRDKNDVGELENWIEKNYGSEILEAIGEQD